MGKIWLISFLIIAVLASGCTYGPKTEIQPAAANTVEIKGYAFSPDTITIAKGTMVKWINQDSVEHTVTGDGNDIDSPILS